MSSSSKTIKPYSLLAQVYDKTFNHVPYYSWFDTIDWWLSMAYINANDVIIELGSGTGNLLKYLQTKYKSAMGLDYSREMLLQAREKKVLNNICAPMQSLPIKSNSVKAIISVHDSINYLPGKTALIDTFEEILRTLKPKGLFIFDICTLANVELNYDNRSFHNDFKNFNVTWNNQYNAENRTLTSTLVFQGRDKKQYSEVHQHSIFSEEEVESILHSLGFAKIDSAPDYRLGQSVDEANLLSLVYQKL